jgi:hypothetical protein
MRETGGIEIRDTRQVGANHVGDDALSCCGSIRKHRAQRRSGANVDAKRSRLLREGAEEILGDVIEQCSRSGLVLRGSGSVTSTRRYQWKSGGRCKRREEFAAGEVAGEHGYGSAGGRQQ